MAEFCLDCWNKINQTDDPADRYIISNELDLCEGCGKVKHVIVRKRYWCEILFGRWRNPQKE